MTPDVWICVSKVGLYGSKLISEPRTLYSDQRQLIKQQSEQPPLTGTVKEANAPDV